MRAVVHPSITHGSVQIPPSKSMAHRAILCAALAKGTSTISNVAYSQDILATIEGMRALGAQIETKENHVVIKGIQDFNHLKQEEIFCCESGSTLRFFIPIFSLCNKAISFTAQGRLLQRPQKIYADIFHEQGLPFLQDEQGIHIAKSLKAQEYTLKGDVSSQFISGLLFALPLLEKDSIIHILAPYESFSYVDLTLQMLERFGVQAYYTDTYTLHIPGKQSYKASDYSVEGDYSQFAFFAVLAAIQNDLQINGVDSYSKQGDKQIIDILQSFGATIEKTKHGYMVHKSPLKACAINLKNCPDLGPILCVLGMYASGTTHIYNAGRLRIKESDRIAAMEQELRKFRVDIHSNENEVWISGIQNPSCDNLLEGHNDHRIVMALCIAILCSQTSSSIEGANAINKSYPDFFTDIKAIDGKVELL